MEKITIFLAKLVKHAANLVTSDFEVKAKDDKGDVVTNMDTKIEEFLILSLKNKYPDFDIVSEEFNSKKKVTPNCFIIDPIDGTANFSYNIPLWGIQIACVKNGEVCSAAIYLPCLKELYYADSSGAYLNKKPISVKDYPKRRVFAVEGTEAIKILAENETKEVKFRSNKACCVNFAWASRGCYSGAFFHKDNPWDYIPGQYLMERAGGVSYNESCMHITAASPEALEILKNILKK
ncbi:MAG: inositol monophosphatase [Clostridia bacterium]|nr:inositol monophosphatase [Clostridia bacterium]